MFKKTLNEDNKLYFDIINDGNTKIVLINGLRRTILSDIPVYIIDTSTTKFEKNTTVFNNDILKIRLKLIPLNFDKISYSDYENIEISYNFKNVKEGIHSVYVKDFRVLNKENGTELKDVFTHPDILFCKIKYGQELSFSTYLNKGNTKEFDFCASPVSQSTYSFKVDQKRVDERIKHKRKIC